MIHSSTLGFSPQPPVSVCGTGLCGLELSGFSREYDYPRYRRPRRFAVLSAFGSPPGFAWAAYTYGLQRTIPSVRGGATPPSPLRSHKEYGNVDPLSIHCPFRVRVRSRLTLIRLALIRKPWSFGGRVSRPPYRYLCLHLLFQKVHSASPPCFAPAGMLPYQMYLMVQIHCFGNTLDARLLSTPGRSTSELLRTL